ncbi:MAG: hypothetical protein ACYTG7_09845 [Planctomycetota bacterium]|jgi:hypothetical protein
MIIGASRQWLRTTLPALFGVSLLAFSLACSGDRNGQGSDVLASSGGWACEDPSAGCLDGSMQKGNFSMSEQQDFVNPGIPPIDATAPERIQTATFAMG